LFMSRAGTAGWKSSGNLILCFFFLFTHFPGFSFVSAAGWLAMVLAWLGKPSGQYDYDGTILVRGERRVMGYGIMFTWAAWLVFLRVGVWLSLGAGVLDDTWVSGRATGQCDDTGPRGAWEAKPDL
jgi:hypothetical protein